MIITWAMIMAAGVNSSPKTPNGPERDKSRYTIKPTTTGGKPIRAFKVAITKRRWRNRRMANHVPKGRATAEAITKALKLTCKDLTVISIRSASRDHISRNASAIPAHISLMSKPSRSLRHLHGSRRGTVSNTRAWHRIQARLKTSFAMTAMGRVADRLQTWGRIAARAITTGRASTGAINCNLRDIA